MSLTKGLRLAWILMLISSLSYLHSINYIVRAFSILFSGVVVLYTISRNNIHVLKKDYFVISFILYLIVCTLSIVVSVDAFASVFKLTELAIDFLLVYIAYVFERKENDRFTPSYCIKSWIYFSIIVLLIIWIGYFTAPSLFSTRSRGLISKQLGANMLISCNAIGSVAAAVIIYMLCSKEIRHKTFFIVLMSASVIFSMSRTSLFIVFIAVGLYFVLSKFRFRNLFLFVIAGFLLFYYYDTIIAFVMRGQSQQDFSSMSGRTLMWTKVLEVVKESPLLGFGYGSGSNLIELDNTAMTSVHNGFFEVLIDTGYLGVSFLILYTLCSFSALIKRIKIYRMSNCIMPILLHVYIITRTFLSLGLGGWHTLDMMLFFAMTFDDLSAITKGRTCYERK